MVRRSTGSRWAHHERLIFQRFLRSNSKEEAIQQISSFVNEQNASISSSVDTNEIEFCRTKTLSQIRELLARKSPIEQAMLLVLLEHFRPEFFALDQQLITQGLVDLGEASEIVEQLRSGLMFSKNTPQLDACKLAIIKYFLLKAVKDSNGTVNLRGSHYHRWINVLGIVATPEGDILKLLIDIDPYQIPPELDRYVNYGLRPINWEKCFEILQKYK